MIVLLQSIVTLQVHGTHTCIYTRTHTCLVAHRQLCWWNCHWQSQDIASLGTTTAKNIV